MVVRGKKKYKTGEAAQFLTRKSALKKLQLSLNEFRRLCILKGIYPREPRNRKRAQKGQPGIKILYHIKDIQFLMHEPIVWKLREYKIFNRKVSHARALKDFRAMKRYLRNHPTIKLDHIVKERYPTFIDALKDLDDCLTLCFLFSTFPSMSHVPREQSKLCRRLTVEFMHAVVASRSLRKVFISIKGYYYQAEISGETVTWIVPHHFGFQPQAKAEVDFKLMSTFVEFYVYMLGFVNFRLYQMSNLYYPPKLSIQGSSERELVDEEAFVSERVAALNHPLTNLQSSTENAEEEVTLDSFVQDDSEAGKTAQEEAESIKKLKTLFDGMKVFLNREVPREPLVFVLRCFGAEVSWDKTLFVGSTFNEDDESITHQIVDRPDMDKQFISRYYVQPQWVFDSVNARELMPVEKYLIGCTLPPHLSPFKDNRRNQEYIPPEERALMDPEYKMNYDDDELDSELEKDLKDEDDGAVDKMSEDESAEKDEEDSAKKNEDVCGEENVVDDVDSEEEILRDVGVKHPKSMKPKTEEEKQRLEKKKKMQVKSGEVLKPEPWEKERQEKQEYKLREKMIKKKHRKLYRSMMEGRKDRAKAIWLLRKKRRLHEEAEKQEKREVKRAQRRAATQETN